MRPTLLNHRGPHQKTPDYRITKVLRNGDNLDSPNKSHNRNPKKSNFPQDQRFPMERMYCKGTGQSVYIGPGSYNADKNYSQLVR